jgi:hypothetical protein
MTQQPPVILSDEMLAELRLINLHAEALNQEAADVLAYQCQYILDSPVVDCTFRV